MVSVSRMHTQAVDPDDLEELITGRATATNAKPIDQRRQRRWQPRLGRGSHPRGASAPKAINEAAITVGNNQPTS